MTHPEELFAGYVDGTLSSEDRVAVETHLAGCARCTRDIELAAGARSALRSMTEEPAPAGIASKALQEAAGVRPAVGGGTPRWYRVGGMVAAAAAGLLVFSLVLPNIGQNDASDRDTAAAKAEDAAGGGAGGAVATLGATQIEIRQVNYDDASLTGFTSSYRTVADGSVEMGTAEAPVAPVFGTEAQTDKALACVAGAAPAESGDAAEPDPRAVQGDARLPRRLLRVTGSRPTLRPGHGLGPSHRVTAGSSPSHPRRCSAAPLHRAAARRE